MALTVTVQSPSTGPITTAPRPTRLAATRERARRVVDLVVDVVTPPAEISIGLRRFVAYIGGASLVASGGTALIAFVVR